MTYKYLVDTVSQLAQTQTFQQGFEQLESLLQTFNIDTLDALLLGCGIIP